MSSISTTTLSKTFQLKPANSSVLVDDSQTSPPDSLDPDTGFFTQDAPVFTSVFQQLVAYNGSNFNEVVPAVAQNWSISPNYENYTFTIRPGVRFSNGDNVTAATVWFSFVRAAYLGQAAGLSNYIELTINVTEYTNTGYAFPWGIRRAIQVATGLPAVTNSTVAAEALNNILSNFNPDNKTIQEVMSYPDQAYVVLGNMVFRTNLLEPYRFWLLDIAAWWGAVLDPSYIDSHGGVQGNTPDSYVNVNGAPGTGPYEIRSISPAFSTIVLTPNPYYWAIGKSNVPYVDKPPSIPYIVINFGLSHNERVETFAANEAQISYVSIPSFEQMYQAYDYKQYYGFNQIFKNLGYQPAVFFLAMNTQKFPTSIDDFRLAVVHAINYTEILDTLYGFNGTLLAQMYLGPISPQFPEFYNPGNLPLYTYNISLAEHYMNESGWQGGFYVLTPNGTILGNPKGYQLPPQVITYISPITPFESTELTIIQNGLSQIGLSVTLQGVTPAVRRSWTTPAETPNFVDLGWFPDWPDPIFQQMLPVVTTTSDLTAWMNVSKVNQIMQVLPFLSNLTEMIQFDKEVYNITYWYAPDAWLPNPVTYYFVQPYVEGFVYNEFAGYYYNTMYYNITG